MAELARMRERERENDLMPEFEEQTCSTHKSGGPGRLLVPRRRRRQGKRYDFVAAAIETGEEFYYFS